MKRPKLKIAAKFSIVLLVLVPAIAFLTWVSLSGLGRINTEVESLFDRNLTALEAVDSIVAEIFEVEELILLADVDEARREEAEAELAKVDASVERELKQVERLYADVPAVLAPAKKLDAGFTEFERRLERGDFAAQVKADQVGVAGAEERLEQTSKVAEATDAALKPLETQAQGLRDMLRKRRAERRAEIEASFADTQRLMLIGGAVALLLGVAAIGWLIRNVTPRVRAYSEFAGRVAGGT